MVKRSKDARAVVTGAGSGIGRAFAIELAERGGQVVCADIDLASAKETVVRIEASGGDALPALCNVSVEDDVRELAATASEWLGGAPDLVTTSCPRCMRRATEASSTPRRQRASRRLRAWGPTTSARPA